MKIALFASLLLGIALAGFGAYFVHIAQQARTWTEVQGVVLTNGNDRRVRNPRYTDSEADRERKRVFSPFVKYQWKVGQDFYVGSNYRLGSGRSLGKFPTRDAANAALSEYPPGRELKVYVNPKDPSQAVLNTDLDWGAWVPLVLGFFVLAFTALAWHKLGTTLP